MKHRIVGRRLDRTTEHRTAMFKNMVTSLFLHERVKTTTPKAKELRRYADKLITMAKAGTSHSRRLANRHVRDVDVLAKLFETLGPRFKARPGGYTRIIRVGRRVGDNADMAVIELVEKTPPPAEEAGETKGKKGKAVAAKGEPAEAAAGGKPTAEKKPKEKKAKGVKAEKADE